MNESQKALVNNFVQFLGILNLPANDISPKIDAEGTIYFEDQETMKAFSAFRYAYATGFTSGRNIMYKKLTEMSGKYMADLMAAAPK